MIKKISSIVALSLITIKVIAQEKLYLKTEKKPISCKIIEINTTELKYQPDDAPNTTIGVDKVDVIKVVYQSGRTQYFTNSLDDFNYYNGQKRCIAKVGLLSPLLGYTDLYLEQSIKPGSSIEYQMNIIGLGKNIKPWEYTGNGIDKMYMNQKGVALGIGYKVLRTPDYDVRNKRLSHILQGSYLKPNVIFGVYNRKFYINDNNGFLPYIGKSKTVVMGQVGISFGKQWIFDNTFSVEIFGSLGIGFDNYRNQQEKIKRDYNNGTPFSNVEEYAPYPNFGYTRFGSGTTGLTFGGGLKIGYLFHNKKSKEESKIGGIDRMRDRMNK